MTVLTRYLGRTGVLAVLIGLAVPLAVLPDTTPARAHTALRSTVPTSGATIDRPVDAVTLTFTQPVKERFTTVVVSAAGAAFGAGPARVSGVQVTQPVGRLPVGLVTVAWRTVAVDGFPVQGTFTFTTAYPAPPGGDGTAAPRTASPGTAPKDAAGSTGQDGAPVTVVGGPEVTSTGSAGANRTAAELRRYTTAAPVVAVAVATIAAVAAVLLLAVRRRRRRDA